MTDEQKQLRLRDTYTRMVTESVLASIDPAAWTEKAIAFFDADVPELLRMAQDLAELRAKVRWHRQQWESGDDACWQDNEALYQLLPEGFTPPARNTTVELKNCERYLASCQHPGTVYISPQRRIEELEAEVAKLTEANQRLYDLTRTNHAISQPPGLPAELHGHAG